MKCIILSRALKTSSVLHFKKVYRLGFMSIWHKIKHRFPVWDQEPHKLSVANNKNQNTKLPFQCFSHPADELSLQRFGLHPVTVSISLQADFMTSLFWCAVLVGLPTVYTFNKDHSCQQSNPVPFEWACLRWVTHWKSSMDETLKIT